MEIWSESSRDTMDAMHTEAVAEKPVQETFVLQDEIITAEVAELTPEHAGRRLKVLALRDREIRIARAHDAHKHASLHQRAAALFLNATRNKRHENDNIPTPDLH